MNLYMWFKNMFEALEDPRFTDRDGNGKLFIPEDHLGHILNINETALSIERGSGNRGGSPEATLFDPRLIQLG